MLPTTDPGVQVARRRLFAGVYRVLVIHGWKGRAPGSAGEGRDQAPIIRRCHLSVGYSPRRRGAFGARD
jgi:hypothetical protein